MHGKDSEEQWKGCNSQPLNCRDVIDSDRESSLDRFLYETSIRIENRQWRPLWQAFLPLPTLLLLQTFWLQHWPLSCWASRYSGKRFIKYVFVCSGILTPLPKHHTWWKWCWQWRWRWSTWWLSSCCCCWEIAFSDQLSGETPWQSSWSFQFQLRAAPGCSAPPALLASFPLSPKSQVQLSCHNSFDSIDSFD